MSRADYAEGKGMNDIRVLIVEDDCHMRGLLVERLATEGVEAVYEASTLASALGLVRNVDAILCDDVFPVVAGKRGFELAWNAVHEAAETLGKPFTLLTTDEDTEFGALRQGVQVFKKGDASEAVLHLVQSVGEHVLSA
jgi:CheY-like chemotaxis protein